MKLIVGLGNIGREYEGTRHNMGFMAIDKFADMVGGVFNKSGFKGSYGIVKNPLFPEPFIICKPETYMNLSGMCVRPLADYYHIEVEDIIIICDDMALEEGRIRLREKGSSGGQKGLQNIIDQFGTDAIKRIRIGIGEPPHHNAVDHVLSRPTGDALIKIEEATDDAARAIRDSLLDSFAKAMNKYNQSKGR